MLAKMRKEIEMIKASFGKWGSTRERIITDYNSFIIYLSPTNSLTYHINDQ